MKKFYHLSDQELRRQFDAARSHANDLVHAPHEQWRQAYDQCRALGDELVRRFRRSIGFDE